MESKLTRLFLVLFYLNALLIGEEAINLPSDYDKTTKPSGLTQISVSVVPIQLISIDEKNEIMSTSDIIRLWWSDPRLAWNPTDTGTFYKNIPAKSIWLPDLFVINTAEANGFVTITDQNLAFVLYTGDVYLAINIGVLKTRCSLNFYYFPFDIQNCSVKLGSWQYDSSQLKMVSNVSYLDFSRVNTNQIWDMKNYSYSENLSGYRLQFGLAGYDIQFNLIFKRMPMNYILNNIFPCFVLNAVTFISYFLSFAQQSAISIFCNQFKSN